MRILLAAKHAPHGSRPIGGVQSWCRTVCDELEKRGHDVETWGPEQPMPIGQFDFGIIANVSDTSAILDQCTKRVIVCHGIIPAEKPAGGNVVFTSEEVRDHWNGKGPVIRQPIDLDWWHPADVKKRYLTRFSYRGGLPFIQKIADSMGLTYRHIRTSKPGFVRDVLQQSTVVVATGRAALEAMACGIPVVIADHRSAYQKPLMDLDIETAATRNYSGRGGITPTPKNVKAAIDKAIKRGNMWGYVDKYHNAIKITDQLLRVA